MHFYLARLHWTLSANKRVWHRNGYLLNTQAIRAVGERLKHDRIPACPSGSRVFFTKSATFSRTTFRNWAKANNCSITRSAENADVIVYDPTYLRTVLKDKVKCSVKILARENTLYVVDTAPVPGEQQYWIIYDLTKEYLEAIQSLVDQRDTPAQWITTQDLRKQVISNTWTPEYQETITQMLTSDASEDREMGASLLGGLDFFAHPREYIALCLDHLATLKNTKFIQSVDGVLIRRIVYEAQDLPIPVSKRKQPLDYRFMQTMLIMEKLQAGHLITRKEWRKFITLSWSAWMIWVSHIEMHVVGLTLEIKGMQTYHVTYDKLLHSRPRTEQ